MVDLGSGAIGHVVSKPQYAQELADIASNAGVIAVLDKSDREFDQQLNLLLRVESFFRQSVTQPRFCSKRHRRLVGQLVR
ncbi:hypothetical protein JK2ML_2201 [Mycobacterium leprae Kyoto-2]|uniref:Uncharacterized protein n=3 Tax=Mycobacterium leprae TaxID=1769 RepID=Q9CBC5_MYCLE|nr:hypothetical protein DIJ64_12070 [Mycobacterium leprae]OAR20004.1 hypothetical protein A8144_03395 [Mycobacterium leprae 3125609]OAX71477.1 hypothetical protein A3216_05605 [Mycobacterium leprae 7935681]CAR72298.1 hypothetical protein MLBr02201 [Mycobacterium leprae Br4923]BBC17607.1 hypothetical protein JK2ML_2201 [Mycobacterium leprae Kyoto-2]